jgi:acetyl-CoA carboxylase carboxyltransferase component
MISRSQMNRQFYNMGGEGIMQMAPQQMQEQMQNPQQMQQADAEQYRPIADSLSQDPKKALAMLIKMLIEQGVPPEEARKIAMEMIQGVAQGGMEEVSDDNRIEARFGGRMGYANPVELQTISRQRTEFMDLVVFLKE